VCSRRSTSSKLFPSSTGATLRGSLTHSLLGLSFSFTTQLSSPPAAPCCAPHQQSYGQFNDNPIYPLPPGRLPFIMHLLFTAKVSFQGGFCVSAQPEAPPPFLVRPVRGCIFIRRAFLSTEDRLQNIYGCSCGEDGTAREQLCLK
jgi:hypothetical protein